MIHKKLIIYEGPEVWIKETMINYPYPTGVQTGFVHGQSYKIITQDVTNNDPNCNGDCRRCDDPECDDE